MVQIQEREREMKRKEGILKYIKLKSKSDWIVSK